MFIVFIHVSGNSIFTTVLIHFPENYICLLQTNTCIDYKSMLTLTSQKACLKTGVTFATFHPQVPEWFL